MELQEKLTQFRKDRGLSQMEVAEELGVSRQAVSRWETGAAVPSSSNLICLSKLYGVSLDALVREDVEIQAEEPPETLHPPAEEEPPENPPPPAAENSKGKPKRRVISFILIVAGIIAPYLIIWTIGELTRSPMQAAMFMEQLWWIMWAGFIFYGLYKLIIFAKRR